jgi:putative transposase
MPQYFRRGRPSRGVFEYGNTPTLVFLTVCTKNRAHWLANSTVHRLLQDVWREGHRWRVGRYVVMPDHLHLFACPGEECCQFDAWVKFWKAQVSMRVCDSSCRWQRASFHHRIRSYEGAEERFAYVRMNPVRKGLVESPEQWEFQGEIFKLQCWW